MRELGETKVGGMELIKNLKADSSFESNNVSTTRANNVARAYGWWIAKDCINLTVLKASRGFNEA
jgi:nucleolar MIF4G domain-containing protein 1